MSTDLSFSGDDFDLTFSDNDIDMVSGGAEVSQNSAIRLQFIAGEQFDDTRVGVPWLTDMVSPQVSMVAKNQVLRRTILSTPGARTLDSFSTSVDTVTGRPQTEFTGTTEDNEFFGSQ